MLTLIVFEFPWQGPFGDEMAAGLGDLAASIAAEPGLVWKVWIEDPARSVAGGVYLFDDATAAAAYTAKHRARLEGLGVTRIDVRSYDVNMALSQTTRATLAAR